MISIGFVPPEIILSSQLENINIFSDSDSVDVKFSADGVLLFSETFFVLDGFVSVSNLSEIVDMFILKLNGKNFCDCVLSASGNGSASVAFRVMYCSRKVDIQDCMAWLKLNFLTFSPFRRVAPSEVVKLIWYGGSDDNIVSVSSTFLDPDGLSHVHEYRPSNVFDFEDAADLHFFEVCPDLIADRIKSELHLDCITLHSFTVRCNDRSVTCFVDLRHLSASKFFFLNCFGIQDSVSVQCRTTAVASSERQVASIGGTSLFYDVVNSREFEVQTAPLTPVECSSLEQLLFSPKVKIQWRGDDTDFDALHEILITDFTCDISNSDDELNDVMFTWRFADSVPSVDLPVSGEIFDSNYNPVFS